MFYPVDARAALYLVLPMLLCLYYWKFHNKSFLVLVFTLVIKVFYSFVLLYLVIYRWDFGDLPTYYSYAHHVDFSHFVLESGALLVAQLHSVVFYVLGTSLYGLTLLSACVSHLAFTLMCEKFFRASELRFKNNALFFINFLPILSMQSTYVGREPWILLSTSILFYLLDDKVFNKFVAIFLLLFIFLTRPYQGAIVGLSFSLSILLYYRLFNPRVFLFSILSIPVAFFVFNKIYFYFEMLSTIGLVAFLGESYAGGNQIFPPYPFPFTFMQLFRPFPWDSLDPVMLLSSFENAFVSILFLKLVFLFFYRGFGPFRQGGILALFMFIFFCIFGGLFMFSENIGDLSRRHVYYYPFIILFYFKVFPPLFRSSFGNVKFT